MYSHFMDFRFLCLSVFFYLPKCAKSILSVTQSVQRPTSIEGCEHADLCCSLQIHFGIIAFLLSTSHSPPFAIELAYRVVCGWYGFDSTAAAAGGGPFY